MAFIYLSPIKLVAAAPSIVLFKTIPINNPDGFPRQAANNPLSKNHQLDNFSGESKRDY